jgi:uncharacterized protein YidB (DUF937 family)
VADSALPQAAATGEKLTSWIGHRQNQFMEPASASAP